MRKERPTVILLDLDLGVFGDGVDLVQPLTALGARVLVVSGSTDRLQLAETVERRAVGFLSKTAPFETLLSTILDVAAQRVVLSTTALRAHGGAACGPPPEARISLRSRH